MDFLTLTPADIDECGTTQAGNCEHRCENILGSYQRYCNEGYSMQDNKCKRMIICPLSIPDTLSS